MGLEDWSKIVLAMANIHMLIEGGIGHEAEADLVARRHHDGVIVRNGRAAHHVRALDGCTGGASANGASAVEYLEEFFQGEGVEISVSDAPVASADKPDAGRVFQRRDEGTRVRNGAVVRVHHGAGNGGKGRELTLGAAVLLL